MRGEDFFRNTGIEFTLSHVIRAAFHTHAFLVSSTGGQSTLTNAQLGGDRQEEL